MYDCACMIDLDIDGDALRGHHARRGVTRRLHKCDECAEMIQPGDVCELATWRGHERAQWRGYNGTRERHYTCADCLSIRDALFCGSWYYGNVLEEVVEHIYENSGEVAPACILQLTEAAKDWVCSVIQDTFDEINEMEADSE